jgi:hypothetical protein
MVERKENKPVQNRFSGFFLGNKKYPSRKVQQKPTTCSQMFFIRPISKIMNKDRNKPVVIKGMGQTPEWKYCHLAEN